MDIAVLGGTGNLGYGLAARMAAAGHRVFIGSRDAQRAQAAAAALNELTSTQNLIGRTNAQAIEQAEIVIVAVPAAAQAETLQGIAAAVGDRVIVDATVSLNPKDVTSTLPPEEGSCALRARALLPEGSRVVAAFHTLSGKLLADLSKEVSADALVCGDHADAKGTVGVLCESMGMKAIDVGPLSRSSTLEQLTAMIIGLNKRYRRAHVGVHFTGL